MIRFSFLLLLMFFLTISYAQTSKKTTDKKFETYLKLGFKYHDIRKLDSSKHFLRKLDSITKRSPEDSLKFYRKETLDATLLIRENKAAISVQKLLKSLTYFKQQKDSSNIGFCLLKIGIANYYLNRRLVTKEYLEQALLYKTSLSKRAITRIYQNIGTINLEEGMKKNDSLVYVAIESYKEAIEIYIEEKWTLDQTLATSLLAECYNQLNNFDKALLIIEEAILLSKKIKNKSQEGFALIKKASFLGNKKNYKEALKAIRITKPIFKNLGDNPTYLYALLEEKKILKGLSKFKEATDIGDEIYGVSVGNYNTRFADKVAEMDAKYKTAEKQKEIAEQKEEILAKELSIKNRNLYGILLTSAFLILGILSYGYYHRSRFKRKQLQKEIDLKDALATIKTQNRLQEQRLQISRDLHDNIGSQLTFIISSIDNLKYISKDGDSTLKNKLSTISSFTSETIHQLRDTIWAMNRNKISIEDLHSRILSFIEKAKSATENIDFEINQNINGKLNLSSLKGMNLFRVIQEAINNAIKYAQASKITINLYKKENQILISIVDNGVGFDLKKTSIGNGLRNIEERMNKIKGKSFINSSEKGTTIKIEV